VDEMKKLGVAVIGIGFWGRNHVRVFSELPETELKAVCDVNKERAKAIANQYKVDVYTDSRKLLKREDIEAVSICTWTTTHAEEALRAIRAGKDLLVEKPIASTVREAKRIVNLAERRNTRLMVGFIERFNPGVQIAKNMVYKDEIGTLVSATSKRVSEWPERVGDVGVVKDTAIHDIDLMRFVFDEEPSAVFAKIGNLRHTRYEDYAQIMLTFEKGKTAFIEANWLTPYKTRNLLITGSRAILNLNYLTQEITIETAGQSTTPRHAGQEPLKLELKHFAESVLNYKTPNVTGIDGLRALEIAEASFKSSKQNRAVKLKFGD
jgi:UDP-N-acetylglucosamine 3-dehydrogenase